jgi:hypothetical protein
MKDEDGGVAAAARRAQQAQVTGKQPKRQAESTDAIASFLTRRFGCVGGSEPALPHSQRLRRRLHLRG